MKLNIYIYIYIYIYILANILSDDSNNTCVHLNRWIWGRRSEWIWIYL